MLYKDREAVMDRESSGMTHVHRHNAPRHPGQLAGTPVLTAARTAPGTRTDSPTGRAGLGNPGRPEAPHIPQGDARNPRASAVRRWA